MKDPVWIQDDVVLAIHNRQLAEHGGPSGIRDPGLLESALQAPRNRWHYEQSGIAVLAASYAFHLVRNHPFIDGNKRTAYVCLRLFLRLNGLDLEASNEEKVRAMLNLAAGRTSLEELSDWVASKLKPQSQ